jgi:hypothetical protein
MLLGLAAAPHESCLVFTQLDLVLLLQLDLGLQIIRSRLVKDNPVVPVDLISMSEWRYWPPVRYGFIFSRIGGHTRF